MQRRQGHCAGQACAARAVSGVGLLRFLLDTLEAARRQTASTMHPSGPSQNTAAQFSAVCSNAKTCDIGEKLLSVSDSILRPQERLIHAGALVHPRTLHRRPVSRLHPYATVARSPAAMSPVPEPGRGAVKHVPLPPRG